MSRVRWSDSSLGVPETEMFQSLGVSLPSGESASDFVEGKRGSAVRLVGHLLGRAVLLGAGLAVAGARDKDLVKYSLAGATAIEVFVLLYAWANKEK